MACSVAIFDDQLVPANQPLLPIGSRSVMYGDGCFDTFRSHEGDFFRLRDHWARFTRACNFLSLNLGTEFDFSHLKSLLVLLMKENGLMQADAWYRIQAWRKGERGYQPGTDDAHVNIQCGTLSATDKLKPLTMLTAETRRIPRAALNPDYKLTNGLNYILAAREAKQAGRDEALMLTIDDWVSEATSANIFWIDGDQIYTPSKKCDLLPGIMRDTLMTIITKNDVLTLQEGCFQRSDVAQAEALFLCNSVKGIQPVRTVDEYRFDPKHNTIAMLNEELKQTIAADSESITDE